MSIADKLLTIADNTPAVCEAVKSAVTTVSGEVVTADDVGSEEHKLEIKLTSTAVTDFSDVNVSRYGKNLFNINHSNINATYVESFDGNTITLHNIHPTLGALTGTNRIGQTYILPYNLCGKTVTCSAKIKTSGTNEALIRLNEFNTQTGSFGKTVGLKSLSSQTEIVIQFTATIPDKLADGMSLAFLLYVNGGGTIAAGEKVTTSYSDIQIEIGDTATDYEPYKEPQTAIANADGTVEGVTSLSPNMTVLTDTDGVCIECKYRTEANQEKWDKLAVLRGKLEAAKEAVRKCRT